MPNFLLVSIIFGALAVFVPGCFIVRGKKNRERLEELERLKQKYDPDFIAAEKEVEAFLRREDFNDVDLECVKDTPREDIPCVSLKEQEKSDAWTWRRLFFSPDTENDLSIAFNNLEVAEKYRAFGEWKARHPETKSGKYFGRNV